MHLSRRATAASILSTALLLTGCTGDPDFDQAIVDEVVADDPAPADDPPAPDADADADADADEPMAAGPTSGCVQTRHTEISIDDVTYPSFLEWWFLGTIDGVEVTVVSPEMNNGAPITTTAANGEARVQMGINAYGDYFPPEVTVDGVVYAFEMSEPYTVDADEGADSEVCIDFQQAAA